MGTFVAGATGLGVGFDFDDLDIVDLLNRNSATVTPTRVRPTGAVKAWTASASPWAWLLKEMQSRLLIVSPV